MKNKRGQILIIGIVLLAIASIVGLIASENLNLAQITGTPGGYIERPVFKYIKCEAIGSLKYSTPYTTTKSPEWVIKPTISSSYNIKVTMPSSMVYLAFEQYIKYSVCNSQFESQSNCRIYNQLIRPTTPNFIYDINNVRNNEYVYLGFKESLIGLIFKDHPGLQYQIGFVPYGLREYDVLSAPQGAINPSDCSVPNIAQTKDQVLSTDSQKVSGHVSPNVNQNVFQPEEVRWYVSGYVSSAAPSFAFTYAGQNAWCRSGNIYKINSITTTTGTYRIASPDYSDKLGQVTCCPKDVQGSQVCNDNFQWVTIQGSQCGSFKSCGSPNPVPYSTKQTIQYYCDNGYCKSTINNVECANDFDCNDANKVCDLNVYKCVNANVNLQGQVINTIPDNKADCESKGGKWITQTTQEKSIWNYLGIGQPKTIITEYCEMGKPFNWMILLWIAGGIIVLILLWKTGVWKRVIPLFKAIPLFIKIVLILTLLIVIILIIPK